MDKPITPRNAVEQDIYDKSLAHYRQHFNHPAITVHDIAPEEAAFRMATEKLHRYQVAKDTRDSLSCCQRMEEEVEDGTLISIYVINQAERMIPSVHIISDAGHGGNAEISYCPFCGTKINLHGE